MDDDTTKLPESSDAEPAARPDAQTELLTDLDEERAEHKKLGSRTIGLLIALGVLLVGIIVLLILLLLPRDSGVPVTSLPTPTDSASASLEPAPSETPSDSPAPTSPATPSTSASPPATSAPAEPSGPDAAIASFTAPSTAGCLSPEAPAFQPTVDITFVWRAQNVSKVAFGVATSDAISEPYAHGLAPSGSITVGFPCDLSKQKYTLTVAGADDIHVSKSITVNNPSA